MVDELLAALPEATAEYRERSKRNTNRFLLLRSSHKNEWEKECEMFREYPATIRSHGCIPSLDIFVDIAVWKLGGNAGRNIRHLATNDRNQVVRATEQAFGTADVGEAMSILVDSLAGIGPAAASGLMTFSDPERFTPMDTRVLEALSSFDLWDGQLEASTAEYQRYCERCRDLLQRSDLETLRDHDRALWVVGQRRAEGASGLTRE